MKEKSTLLVCYGVGTHMSKKIYRTPVVSLALILMKKGKQEILLSFVQVDRPIGVEHGERFNENLKSGITEIIKNIPDEHRFLYDKIEFHSGKFYNPQTRTLEDSYRLPETHEILIQQEVLDKILTV